MKRNFKYFVIIFLISVFIGFMFGKMMKNTNNIANQNIISENKIITSEFDTAKDMNILETSFEEEKITANTNLILRKYYLDCNHIISKEVELPEELINQTEDEIKENYSDWEIEEFSNNQVTLSKKIYGLCGEHFIIKSGDDFIEVYSLDEEYDKKLYETTNISVEYLAEEDLEKLEEGIYVYGTQELNATLESFE